MNKVIYVAILDPDTNEVLTDFAMQEEIFKSNKIINNLRRYWDKATDKQIQLRDMLFNPESKLVRKPYRKNI